MSLIGLMMSVCSVCGEVAMPLPDWEPIETENPDGSITVQGTLCYCACSRPEPEGVTPQA